MSKKKKARAKKYTPRPVIANDLFLEWAPEVAEKTRVRLGTMRGMHFRELMAGRGNSEQIAGLQAAIELAWVLASRFESKVDLCMLLLCASAELQAMSTIVEKLKRPDLVEPWMGNAMRHALDTLDDIDASVTTAEYLRAIRYMTEHHTKVLTVGGAECAACIDPASKDSWEKFLPFVLIAYLHGRPVRGFLIVRKGILYFCAPEQGEVAGDDALIRIEGPHVIAVCHQISPEALKDVNEAREREK